MPRANDGHRSAEALTRHLSRSPDHCIIFETRDYSLVELVQIHRAEHTLTPHTGDAELQSIMYVREHDDEF